MNIYIYIYLTVKFSLTCIMERRTGKVSSDRFCGRQTSQRQTTRDLPLLPRQDKAEIVNGNFTRIELFIPSCVHSNLRLRTRYLTMMLMMMIYISSSNHLKANH